MVEKASPAFQVVLGKSNEGSGQDGEGCNIAEHGAEMQCCQQLNSENAGDDPENGEGTHLDNCHGMQ